MTTSNDPFAAVVPLQIPEQVRAFAEKGVAQARDNYAKLRETAETNNAAIEAAYTTASKGATDFTLKLMDIAKTNTTSVFDFAQNFVAVKSLPEAFSLMNEHARKQYETLTAQSRELMSFSRQVATDTAEPIKAGAEKVSRQAA